MVNVHGGDIYTHKGVIDFSANINPLGIAPSVLKAAKDSLEGVMNYPDVTCRTLRRALSEKESISEDFIICGNGAAELIFNLVLAVRPKKALLVMPSFAEYEQALGQLEAEVCFYKLHEEKGFCLEEDYLDDLKADIDMAFLCNPNNPTGKTIAPNLLERIIDKCEENHILLVLDECFNDFLDKPDKESMKHKVIHRKQLFILKAFTKMYAMAGLRLGYGLCSNAALLEKMYRLRQPWSVSIPAQAAGVAALKETELPIMTRAYIKAEREKLCAALKSLDITYYKPEANYIFIKTSPHLKEDLLKQNILIRDCSNYPGLELGYYRIAVKGKEDNEKLIQALKALKDKGGNEYGKSKVNYDPRNNVKRW